MKKEQTDTRKTPFLSGGYLNWVVYNKNMNAQKQDVFRMLSSRPRDRTINRMH